ncbi:DUF4384 domain-containing protein [Rhodovulum sp. 12E13]|uniref:DUF4384 domain-containing protein n=1 Tax=Rhodovulum sp. 12E13 TaxID=2203891 RepID=UPI000E16A300|nr:DUF4384 domain-containing protein [Rhodovulum sp. 12E13]RDC74047.1 DUF4384 domain-containing protein [Rhodovulum sp. 12E13]
MKRATLAAAGLAASIALHGAGAGLVWLAVRPTPGEDQHPQEARLALATAAVDRAEAARAAPDTDAAPEHAAEGQGLAAGVVPRTEARAALPRAETRAAANAPAIALAAAFPAPGRIDAPSTQAQALAPTQAPVAAARPAVPPAPDRPAALPAPVTPVATQGPPARPADAASPVGPSVVPEGVPVAPLAEAAPAATRLPPSPTPATGLTAALPQADALAAATRPAARVDTAAPAFAAIGSAAPEGVLLAAVPSPAATVPLTLPRPSPTAPADAPAAPLLEAEPLAGPPRPAAPRSSPLATAETDAATLPATTPDAAALAAAAPTPRPAPPGAAPVARQRARTAIEGFADISDPVSLAALQSFMAPDTLAPEADIRDGLAGLLGGVPCARLQARFVPETGTLELHGHVPEEGAAAPVLAALRAEMGADIPVQPNLRVLPRPQCDVLSAIAAAGLPQSTDQALDPRLVGEDTHVREFAFAAGETLELELAAPDYDAYVYVDYFDAAGRVVHLRPNEAVPLRRAEAGSVQTIGGADDGTSGLRLEIGPPFGQEIVVALAASAPLFDAPRPLVEPAAPYLADLSRRIAEARRLDPAFRGEWVYFLVITRPS